MTSFSIITVVMNDVVGVTRTLQSVFEQTWPRYELIVQDGCSTDGTTEVLRSFEGWIDSLVVETDSGIYDAMNRAVDRATCDWIVFMNAADFFINPQVLETVAGMIQPGDDIFVGQPIRDEDGKPHKYRPRNQFWLGSTNDHQATFVRRELMQDLKFDTSLSISGDLDFFTRARALGAREHYQPVPIVRKPFSVGASAGFVDRVRDRVPVLKNAYDEDYPVMATIHKEVRNHIINTYDVDARIIKDWDLEQMMEAIETWDERLA